MNAHARKLLTTLGGTFCLLLASMAAGILLDRAGIGIASATYDIVGFPVIEVRHAGRVDRRPACPCIGS